MATAGYSLANTSGNIIKDIFSVICIGGAAFNPADSTTYYWGISRATAPTTVETNQAFKIGVACKLVGAMVNPVANTAGSSENTTLKLRNVTQATSSSIGTFTANFLTPVIGSFSYTGLNISVAANDLIAVQMDTPAWVTNPLTLGTFVTLFFQIV